MVSRVFPKAIAEMAAGNLNWTSDTIRILLITNGYTYNEANDFVADVVANEATGTTRQTLGTKSVTEDAANDRVILDAADATFAAVPATQTISGAITYKEVTNDADSFVIAFHDGTDLAANGSDIQVQFPATGVLYGSY